MTAPLSDRHARERAATADDRNIVVTAGAGTGKTTLLVNRLLHLLLYHPHPLAIGEIVALTFTNKAADEMKQRSRQRLSELPANELAGAALRDLDKSQIGTIHSFAAHLLRLYPLEGRVDPGFEQDEGRQFDEFFRHEWTTWLDQELGVSGSHEDIWRAALSAVTLDELQELACRLTGELIPLDESPAPDALPLVIREWLLRQACLARELRKTHPKTNILERMLEDAASYLERVSEDGHEAGLPAVELDRDVPPITKQWAPHEYETAKRTIRIAQAVAKVRVDLLQPIVQLLVPFARECRRRFIQTGYVSFDGLVARARGLLRDHLVVRRELKTQFRSILVDEFQDTDPVQYEMILYLAEARDGDATDWRRIMLEPGKLFIVGDPKQSIYAFRRADMEAYDTVIEDHVLAQAAPGERHALQTNFRSHAGLLAPINGLFRRVFPEQAVKGLQPRHDPLLAHEAMHPLPGERVELRLVRTEAEQADADTVGRAESEELARWLREDVLGRDEIFEQGVPVKVKPRHVAILFRTLTEMRDYLEALRRHRIPCLTEGEKHFYERQEVIDAMNLLRAVVEPHDRLALVGVLRSSLGALPDAQIELLNRHQLLDYRLTNPPASIPAEVQDVYASVAPLYSLLRDLSARLPHLPLTEVVDTVLGHAPCLELAAASIDGEQAVANVLKFRDLAVQLAAQPMMTLHSLVNELTARALEVPEEAESSLAEDVSGEGQGFVRLLSIHKAKGLEFPIVVLAGLQRGAHRVPSRVAVAHDWSSGIVGIKVGDLQTIGGVFVEAKLAERQRAEQRRVLYVAMTRAKRKLVLSAGLPKQLAHDSALKMIIDGFGINPDILKPESEVSSTDVSLDGGIVSITVVSGKAVPLSAMRRDAVAWQDLNDNIEHIQGRWKARLLRREEYVQWPAVLSPSLLRSRLSVGGTSYRSMGEGPDSETARQIGILVHSILEQWDFSKDQAALSQYVNFNINNNIHVVIKDILDIFVKSDVYRTLQRATIVGRELPFAIPWSSLDRKTAPYGSAESVMEGMIDLVYRLDGEIWVADYKTDRTSQEDVLARAEEYRTQAEIYMEAVARCLGVTPTGFQFIFLRTGTVVPVLLQGGRA